MLIMSLSYFITTVKDINNNSELKTSFLCPCYYRVKSVVMLDFGARRFHKEKNREFS